MTNRIAPGGWVVDAVCPLCGGQVAIPLSISTVLTTPNDDTPTLGLRSKASKVAHECDGMAP